MRRAYFGVPLQRVPKKYRRTFWEKEELPRTPRLLPKAKGGQAKASDDARAAEGRALKSRLFLLTAQKKKCELNYSRKQSHAFALAHPHLRVSAFAERVNLRHLLKACP